MKSGKARADQRAAGSLAQGLNENRMSVTGAALPAARAASADGFDLIRYCRRDTLHRPMRTGRRDCKHIVRHARYLGQRLRRNPTELRWGCRATGAGVRRQGAIRHRIPVLDDWNPSVNADRLLVVAVSGGRTPCKPARLRFNSSNLVDCEWPLRSARPAQRQVQGRDDEITKRPAYGSGVNADVDGASMVASGSKTMLWH